MVTSLPHIPIMVDEIISILNIESNDIVLDATIGFGGHATHILPLLTDGQYIGVDQDDAAIAYCQTHIADSKLVLIHDNYASIFDHELFSSQLKFSKVILDLGFSSYQLDQSGRGFSFMGDEPLDMRLSLKSELTAADVLNSYKHQQLSDLFYYYGDLIHNKRLVELIIKQRPLTSTAQLFKLIKQSYCFQRRSLLMKTASLVFQALRIEVNDELNQLTSFLESLPQFLMHDARIAILTFHSGEDRLVKKLVNHHLNYKKINKKVIVASSAEIKANSRAKPAKLRGVLFFK